MLKLAAPKRLRQALKGSGHGGVIGFEGRGFPPANGLKASFRFEPQ